MADMVHMAPHYTSVKWACHFGNENVLPLLLGVWPLVPLLLGVRAALLERSVTLR